MGTYGFPDIAGFYDMLYGTAGLDFGSLTLMYFGGASGMVFSGNPPYTLTDFLTIYPKFFGPPTVLNGLTITLGSPIVTVPPGLLVGLAVGQLVVNLNSFPKDTLIESIDTNTNTITLTEVAIATDTTLTVYKAPWAPLIVMMTYLELALASVMQARYKQAWFMQVAYFVAHYLTLYLRTEAGPNLTAAQIASSGLTKGIIVHRAAGDVSASSKVVEGWEQWGAWSETQYGELFITVAMATCSGPVWVP